MGRDVLAVVVLIGAALVASRRVRWIAWVVLRGLSGAALVLVAGFVDRRRRAERRTLLPASHTWRCTLFVEHRGRRQTLVGGAVSGPWVKADDVEREALERWVAAYGWPESGRLCAQAEPVMSR